VAGRLRRPQGHVALSHCGPVDYALDRTYFADRGLLSLEQRYREMHRVVVPAQLSLDLGRLRAEMPALDYGLIPDTSVPQVRFCERWGR
jgi:hypothetical protein